MSRGAIEAVFVRTYRERGVCADRPQIVLMPRNLVQTIPVFLRAATVWPVHKSRDLWSATDLFPETLCGVSAAFCQFYSILTS